MLQKNDLLMLLYDIEKSGVDTKQMLLKASRTPGVNMEVLKFINDNRPLEVKAFYEKLRKSHNDKRSPLYMNIMKSDETELKNLLVVITSLLNQIMLFSDKVEDKQLFLRHARADEITKALYLYLTRFDIQPCVDILQLVKADLKAFESI